jgi:uncharacterized membrane protein YphA (DoxX/SURF4 family)
VAFGGFGAAENWAIKRTTFLKATTQMRDAGLYVDSCLASWMARNSVLLTRVALGVVFFWFGILKFFPGQSDAEGLAAQTIFKLTAGHITSSVSLPVLAIWECLIGLGLLSGKFLRGTLLLLFLQLPGTFLPLLFFPAETWKHAPYAPTLLGQYIIKNLVLVCAGLLVGATMRGGRVIADPQVADNAEWVQRIFERFRRRFGSDPKGASKSLARTRS